MCNIVRRTEYKCLNILYLHKPFYFQIPSGFSPSLSVLKVQLNPLQCDCCNEWMFVYTGTITIVVDQEPCKWPPHMVGLPWADVVNMILRDGCLYTTGSDSIHIYS